MNETIKKYLGYIICIIVGIVIGGAGVGFAIYKFTDADMAKLKIANQRISDDNKTIAKQLTDSKDTITKLNKSIDTSNQYIKQLENTVARITKLNSESSGTIDDNDKLLSRLENIYGDITNEFNKVNNTK